MTADENGTYTEYETYYHVMVEHKGDWLEMAGFSSDNEPDALSGAETLAELGQNVEVRRVDITTTTTVETVRKFVGQEQED